jgi:hypothetical protein
MRVLSIHPRGTSRVLLHAAKSDDMGPSRFPSHPRGRCAADFYGFKKSIALAGFEPATFGSSGKPINHYTTEATAFKYMSSNSESAVISHCCKQLRGSCHQARKQNKVTLVRSEANREYEATVVRCLDRNC